MSYHWHDDEYRWCSCDEDVPDLMADLKASVDEARKQRTSDTASERQETTR